MLYPSSPSLGPTEISLLLPPAPPFTPLGCAGWPPLMDTFSFFNYPPLSFSSCPVLENILNTKLEWGLFGGALGGGV